METMFNSGSPYNVDLGRWDLSKVEDYRSYLILLLDDYVIRLCPDVTELFGWNHLLYGLLYLQSLLLIGCFLVRQILGLLLLH